MTDACEHRCSRRWRWRHRLGRWSRWLCFDCKGFRETCYNRYMAQGGFDRVPPCRICWPKGES